MRAIIQRVDRASVEVEGEVAGAIEHGLLILLGVMQDDHAEDLDWICRKIPQIRCFEDENGKMNRSLLDVDGGILLVSQFTLYGNLKKGTRPSFNRAAAPELAQRLYEQAAAELERQLGKPVAQGIFAAHMDIKAQLNGPVTLILDSREKGL